MTNSEDLLEISGSITLSGHPMADSLSMDGGLRVKRERFASGEIWRTRVEFSPKAIPVASLSSIERIAPSDGRLDPFPGVFLGLIPPGDLVFVAKMAWVVDSGILVGVFPPEAREEDCLFTAKVFIAKTGRPT